MLFPESLLESLLAIDRDSYVLSLNAAFKTVSASPTLCYKNNPCLYCCPSSFLILLLLYFSFLLLLLYFPSLSFLCLAVFLWPLPSHADSSPFFDFGIFSPPFRWVCVCLCVRAHIHTMHGLNCLTFARISQLVSRTASRPHRVPLRTQSCRHTFFRYMNAVCWTTGGWYLC